MREKLTGKNQKGEEGGGLSAIFFFFSPEIVDKSNFRLLGWYEFINKYLISVMCIHVNAGSYGLPDSERVFFVRCALTSCTSAVSLNLYFL